jgi:hypothetical protein
MNLTISWLNEQRACSRAVSWWQSQKETDSIKILRKLMRIKKWEWFVWLAPRLMTYAQKVEWSVFCAEQILPIF